MATNAANDTGLKHIWDRIITLLSNKVDKETGKGLSTNDYTTAEKDLVATIPDKADSDDISGSKEVTANPITLTDSSETYAEELSVDLEPIQSGSGTPSPSNIRPIQGYDTLSVDRCGKNLFDPSQLLVVNGITVTNGVYSFTKDAMIQVFGENTGGYYPRKFKENTQYTISLTGYTERSGWTIYFKHTDGTTVGDSSYATSMSAFSLTSSANKTVKEIYFSYPSYGQVYWKDIQLEEGSTATAYEPYNGQTVSLQLGNKNLLPMTVEGIKETDQDSTWSGNSLTTNGVTFTIVTNSNGIVTKIHAKRVSTSSNIAFLNLCFGQTLSGNYLVNGGNTNSNFYIRIGEGTNPANSGSEKAKNLTGDTAFTADSSKYYAFSLAVTGLFTGETDIYPMLRSASVTDPTFSPYNPTLGGMIYGGQITLNDDGSAEFVGDRSITTKTWSDGTEATQLTNNTRKMFGTLSDASPNNGEISDKLPMIVSWDQDSSHFYIDPTSKILVVFMPTNTSTSTEFTICYKLATPFTMHLSAEQLKLLQGTNNVWSNAGNITLKYQPDNVIAEPKADVQRLRDDVDDRLVGNACRNISYLISLGVYDTSTGADPTYSSSNSDYASCKKVPCKKGESFSVSSGIDIKQVIDYYWDNAGTYLGYYVHNFTAGKYFSFESQHDGVMAVSIRAMAYKTSVNDFLNFQIERGITPTTYEEYYPSNRELYEMIKALQS